MKLILVLLLLILTLPSHAQTDAPPHWNGFFQTLDITAYQGGQFKFKGHVRVDHGNKFSNAALWARVDKKKGMGFFDNMQNRPIMASQWQEYTIEGNIDPSAVTLYVGGLYFGVGKYYFDDFTLTLKRKDGPWEEATLTNAGFENDSFKNDWKDIRDIKDVNTYLSTENTSGGAKALAIDATSKFTNSKFITANGIDIHYQEYGEGDTVLLLHGNSESLQAFNKQIPVLAKEFHVVAMDSRGHGYSTEDGKSLTYELMAEDVNAFLEKRQMKRVNIIGWSDGGNIGLILAMKHPDKVKRLAMMGANLYNDNTSVDKKINALLIKQKNKLTEEGKPENKFELELINLLLYEPKINPDALQTIACPTLVMAGSRDIIKEEHTRLIASKIKHSQLLIFDKGTHFEPRENPERFNTAIITFLKQPL